MLLKRRLTDEYGEVETRQEDTPIPSPADSSPVQIAPEHGQDAGTERPITKSPAPVGTGFRAESSFSRQAQLAATSMSPAESERPSPSKTDALVPYEKLFNVCVKYLSDGYYVGEAIPLKKLDSARASFPIPETERVVALIDTTVFGSNKTGLAFCEGGIYWRNDWTTKANRTFLSWDEFASSTVTSEGKPSGTVELGEGSVLNLSGSAFKKGDAVRLLLEVQSLAKAAVQASRVGTASGGETDRQERLAETDTDRRRAEKTTSSPSEPSASPTPSFDHENRVLGREGSPHPGTGSSLPLKYPIPLAYSYRLVEAEFETLRILKETYRAAEGLSAFLASLTLALMDTPSGVMKKRLRSAWGGKGATFGNWLDVLERTTQQIDEDRGPLYRSIGRLLKTKEGPSQFDENIRWLMDRRNELHHSDLPVGSQTDRLIKEARGRLERCIAETTPIWRHPLRLVLDYDAVRDSPHVVATCLDYSGDHPVGRKVREEYEGVPKKQDLYVLQNGSEWMPLYPFMSVHYCHHCRARETYFIDSWAGPEEEAGLRSFERAHEETSQEIGQDLTRWLDRP